MNKLLTVGALSACLTLTMPVATWANENIKTVETAQDNVATIIKYCNANNVNIRKEPNTQSEILGQAYFNTCFEIVEEKDGWSKFFGEDDNYCGYGYIKSEYLSDAEIMYSEDDLKILAMMLCGECQDKPREEQLRVGSVFLNRIKSKKYPNTFLGVASDKRWGIQYKSWYDGNAFREIQKSNWDNAKWLLENGSILPDYVIGQSQSVPDKCGVYYQSEWHYFWYEK